MKILADSSLLGLSVFFPQPFELTVYNQQDNVANLLQGQEILLCRSTLAVNKALLLNNHALRIIATASSGVDHVDQAYLSNQNIQLLDAKGSNANSVADYVLACIAFLQKFKGFTGKKAGIIGLGAVGTCVANYLKAIHFDIVCYDPPKSVEQVNFTSCSLAELMHCDLLCVHANLHDNLPFPSRNLIAEPELALVRKNTAIINASRGDIISEKALLNLQTPLFYCTDVYSNEPMISDQLVDFSSVCTPHIAGHSLEAKTLAMLMLSQKLHHYYQLPLPNYPPIMKNNIHFLPRNAWQEKVLSLYNPGQETLALKQATNKKDAFLKLRKAHQQRHDFCVYNANVWADEREVLQES